MSKFSKTVFKGVVWSLLDKFGKFALKFFFALVITRILTPTDYGLVAYMGIFMAVAIWLSEGGFGTALIQKENAGDIDYSTVFFFNFSVCVFFFLLYFFSALVVAEFFNEPALISIMRVTSANLVFDSLCYVHQIKLIKSIDFKKQAVVNFASSVISGIVGLSLALRGYGYWALIFQTLTGTILRMIGLWYIVRWIPLLKFSIISFREQFKFGSKVFIQGLFESIFREIHSVVVGKTYRTTALGNYARGHKFFELFIVETGIAINQVLYPTMVKKKEEKNKHRKVYSTMYNMLFFIAAPLSLFLFLLAEPIILVLLTDKWIGAVPFMKLYFIVGFIYVLVHFNSLTILSANKPGLFLRMDVFRNILMAIALIITYKYSIEAIIIGWVGVYYIFYLVYEIKMHQLQYYEHGKYNKMYQVLVCLLPSLLFYTVSAYFISDPLFLLIANALAQPFIYLLVMRYSGFNVYREFSETIKPLLPEKLRFIL